MKRAYFSNAFTWFGPDSQSVQIVISKYVVVFLKVYDKNQWTFWNIFHLLENQSFYCIFCFFEKFVVLRYFFSPFWKSVVSGIFHIKKIILKIFIERVFWVFMKKISNLFFFHWKLYILHAHKKAYGVTHKLHV